MPLNMFIGAAVLDVTSPRTLLLVTLPSVSVALAYCCCSPPARC
jgi:hypothetical protein